MLNQLAIAWADPALWPLLAVTVVAGTVFGFAGFGSALIFIPLASIFMPPPEAVFLLALFDIACVVTVFPRAVRTANLREISPVLAVAVVTLPIGLWGLHAIDATPVRWATCAVGAVALAALLTGWRYRGAVNGLMLAGTGAASGIIGGLTGLTGVVVILFYLGRGVAAEVTRANIIVFLTVLGVGLAIGTWIGITDFPVGMALILTPAYMIATWIGQALFSPQYDRIYRAIAYVIIGFAVVAGLPLWD